MKIAKQFCNIYIEQKTICSPIKGQISSRSLDILTLILLDAKIVWNLHQTTSIASWGAIFWKSVKQSLVPSFAMEVKFTARCEVPDYEIWLQNYITGLHVDNIYRLFELFCNNRLTILYSNNIRSLTKSKYIDIKFLILKERVKWIIVYNTYWNKLYDYDLLTEGVPPKVFHELAHMSVMSLLFFMKVRL